MGQYPAQLSQGYCKWSVSQANRTIGKYRLFVERTTGGLVSCMNISISFIMSFSFVAYLTNERCFIRARVVKGGDPRQNRAMAAKLVYPDLTMRECCYLGGFQDDELNTVKDQKHTWRTGGYAFSFRMYYSTLFAHNHCTCTYLPTGLVHQKESIVKRIEKYENARRNAARLNVEELVNTLHGQEENRFDQVFGENASLLPGFLEAMEERRRNGIVEKPIKSKPRKKRVREEEDDIVDNNMLDEEKPGRKRAHVERGGHRTLV